MQIDKDKIGFAIKTVRKALNISQRRLSEQTGLTINYLSLLENGKRGVGINRLNKIAEVLEVPAYIFIILASVGSGESKKPEDKILKQLQKLIRQAINLSISDL